MNNDTKSPPAEGPEPQKPQSGELDADKLDEVAGGTGGTTTVPKPPVGPGPTG